MSPFPTTAIILAGGFGTRLRSVVSDVPKPMAPINGRPFLDYLLAAIARQGITDVTLAVGYKGELVEGGFGESLHGMRLRYSYEREPLGTGGAVALALEGIDEEEGWILNGDTYFEGDLGAVAKTHRGAGADVTLALKHMDPADRYGLVDVDDGGRITRFREKEPGAAGLINAGVYLLRRSALKASDYPKRFSLERDFFERQVGTLHVQGAVQDGYFVDIGVPEDYERAKGYFRNDSTSP